MRELFISNQISNKQKTKMLKLEENLISSIRFFTTEAIKLLHFKLAERKKTVKAAVFFYYLI